MQRCYRYFDVVMATFVSVLLVSNIASSAKLVDWGVSILGLRLAFDAGTLLFPVSYIFGDVLTEVYGYRRSRRVIWAGFACAGLMAGVFALVGALPPAQGWEYQEAYEAILGTTPRIVLGSLIAYFAGEFSNSYTLARMKIWTQGRWLWTRTIGSTLVGEGVDTVLFVSIAFAGTMPWSLFWSIVVSNYVFKVGLEAVMTPVTYQITSFLKRTENEDVYDVDTDFNPFKLGMT
jgi:hypothetical protein